MIALNTRTGKILATDVRVANTIFARMKGLLGRKELPVGKALWIKPCFSVHTFFMRFPIDVIFLNRQNEVVAVIRDLGPNRVTPLYFKAFSAIELPIGTIADSNTVIGDKINIT